MLFYFDNILMWLISTSRLVDIRFLFSFHYSKFFQQKTLQIKKVTSVDEPKHVSKLSALMQTDEDMKTMLKLGEIKYSVNVQKFVPDESSSYR